MIGIHTIPNMSDTTDDNPLTHSKTDLPTDSSDSTTSSSDSTNLNNTSDSNPSENGASDETSEELNLDEMEMENMDAVDPVDEKETTDTESHTETESDRDSAGSTFKLRTEEDENGREYVTLKGVRYYREDNGWNIPYAVQISFSLIMFVNFVNLFTAMSGMMCHPH